MKIRFIKQYDEPMSRLTFWPGSVYAVAADHGAQGVDIYIASWDKETTYRVPADRYEFVDADPDVPGQKEVGIPVVLLFRVPDTADDAWLAQGVDAMLEHSSAREAFHGLADQWQDAYRTMHPALTEDDETHAYIGYGMDPTLHGYTRSESPPGDLARTLEAVAKAAEGGSNDDHIDALNTALEQALAVIDGTIPDLRNIVRMLADPALTVSALGDLVYTARLKYPKGTI